jgi:hypothetical protein
MLQIRERIKKMKQRLGASFRKEAATQPFCLYPVGQNLEEWPRLAAREAGNCSHYCEHPCSWLTITLEKGRLIAN